MPANFFCTSWRHPAICFFFWTRLPKINFRSWLYAINVINYYKIFWKTILIKPVRVCCNNVAISLRSRRRASSGRMWHSKVRNISPSLKPLSIITWMSFVTGTSRKNGGTGCTEHLIEVRKLKINLSVGKGDTTMSHCHACAMIHPHIFNSVFSPAEISKDIRVHFECTLLYSRSLRESMPLKHSDVHAVVLLLFQPSSVGASFSMIMNHWVPCTFLSRW